MVPCSLHLACYSDRLMVWIKTLPSTTTKTIFGADKNIFLGVGMLPALVLFTTKNRFVWTDNIHVPINASVGSGHGISCPYKSICNPKYQVKKGAQHREQCKRNILQFYYSRDHHWRQQHHLQATVEADNWRHTLYKRRSQVHAEVSEEGRWKQKSEDTSTTAPLHTHLVATPLPVYNIE